jgi:hypothetical protein
LLAAAALLVVGVAGFAATVRYERSVVTLAPLSPVEPIAVRALSAPGANQMLPSFVSEASRVSGAGDIDAHLAEDSTDSTDQSEVRPNVVAAAASQVTILPIPTPTATSTPTASPTPTPTLTPTPTATAVESRGTRFDGFDAPKIPIPIGANPTLADFYGSAGDAGDAPQVNQGPTVVRADLPRDIDPTRPMPR